MAHGPRYTQMAHGGFKSDDRGTWVGLPLETTYFCLLPSHFHFFRENVFHCSSIFCISLSVQMFSYVVFPLAGTMLSLFYSCSAREGDSCMFGFRFQGVFKENQENKIIAQQQSRILFLSRVQVVFRHFSSQSFFEGFSKSNLNKEFGKHNPESSFCQKCEVLGHF